jgi:hypothetical protein
MADAEIFATLVAQAAQLGIKVDGRWSIERLADEVIKGQALHKAQEQIDFDTASTEWVYLFRDGWRLETKHEAGSVIRIPPELADRWIDAGVCRPARQSEVQKYGEP